jgi:hypothetical protein
MPRVSGVSARSTTCCIRRKPRPRIVCRMSLGQPMKLRIHFIFSVSDFLVFVGIVCVRKRYDTTASSAPRPRDSATFAASFRCSSASNVALITLCGFDVPRDFVSTF